MTRKEELLGEYAHIIQHNCNMTHIFRNLLAGISHADLLLADSTFCKDHCAKGEIQKLLAEAIKLLSAYKSLLDDFPKFREHEMNTDDAGTASKYIKAKYLELRGKPLENEKEKQP